MVKLFVKWKNTVKVLSCFSVGCWMCHPPLINHLLVRVGTDWYSHCPVFSCSQAAVSSAAQHLAQHLTPLCCSKISSDGQNGFREVQQENAVLESEPLQSQQAASVCRQPWPGAKHSLSGVLTSLYKHTHAHTKLRPPSQQTYQCMTWPGKEKTWQFRKDCWCWHAGFKCMSLAEWILWCNKRLCMNVPFCCFTLLTDCSIQQP